MMELLWLLLPVAAASGWWAAKREPTPEREAHSGGTEYFQGLNYLLNDKPDKAIEVLSRLADVDRDTAETQMTLGSLFRRRGEVDRAIHIHSNLITKMALTHKQRNHAVLELGEDYLRAGLFDRAESLFRELVQQTDHTAVALERLVAIYEREKEWQQAIVHCERLEHMTGRSMKEQIANYYCELAAAAGTRKAEARAFLAQALARDPHCPRAYIMLGMSAMEEANYEAAITAFQSIEQKACDYFAEVVDSLTECYLALDRREELIDYLDRIQARDHTGRATDALAKILLRKQGEKASLEFLEAGLRRHPTLLGLRRYVELKLSRNEGINHLDLEALFRISKQLLSDAAFYQCESCGLVFNSLHWRCPSCNSWNSIKLLPDLVYRGKAY
jgi:lipopolysaccharide biosynthesis regulator YciM